MFAYCNNNPVNGWDPDGDFYTPGQIHDFVLKDICERSPSKKYTDNYMRYTETIFRKKFYTYGYCDLYDTVTHEIWELKRINSGATCKYIAASIQLSFYVEKGEFVHRPDRGYYKGGTVSTIEANVFMKPDNDGEGVYVIGYFDAGGGVLFYDYMYVPSLEEAAYAVLAVGGTIAIAASAPVLAGAAAGALASVAAAFA